MTTRTQGPSQSRYKHPFLPTILLESLTSTDKRIAGSSLKQTPHSENSQTYIPNRQSSHSSAAAAVTDSSAESVSFNEIDELCTSLRTNLASAELILQKIQDKDSTGAKSLRFTGSNSWHTHACLFSSANVTYLGMLPIHCMQAALWSNACVVLL